MTSGRPTALAHLALVLAGTAMALGLLEVALRALGVETASYHAIAGFTVYDPELGWRLAPARETVFKGAHFSVRVAQNAEGLRDRHYPYEREGRRRILVLGDSVVWCWGVELADCFTERLEGALSDTDVINAGVPAYSTAQEMLLYEREGRRYRPDLVLLVFVSNDPTENVGGWGPRFTLVGDRLAAPAAPAVRRKGRVTEWLGHHSRLFSEVAYMVAVVGQSFRYGRGAGARDVGGRADAPAAEPPPFAPPAPLGTRARLLTEALLDRLAADVARDGARFALVSEALPRPMAEWLHGFCSARGIPYLDLGPALWAATRHGERVRLDGDPHLAPTGQRVVAAELLAFLDREALLPRAGPGGAPTRRPP